MSSVAFDPYHKWLGIPKSEQPAHHYRLLGIPVFEDDPQVIEGASDRQMAFLRKFQSGEHSSDAMKLLNEVSRARLCLLKPELKAEYDATLKLQLAVETITESNATRPIWQQPSVLGGVGVTAVLLVVVAMMLSPSRKPEKPSPTPDEQGGAEVAQSPASAKDDSANSKVQSATKSSVSKFATGGTANKKTATSQDRPLAKGDKAPWPTLLDDEPDTKEFFGPGAGRSKSPANPRGLLAAIDVDRDGIQGTWKKLAGKLLTPSENDFAALQMPTVVPDEFNLVAEITRLQSEGSILLGFPVQGHQSGVAIDGWGGSLSGLETIDEEHPDTHPGRYSGRILELSKPIRVVCQIRRGAVTVHADNKRIVDWKGDPTELAVDAKYRLRPTPGVVIGSRGGQFAISLLELRPVRSKAKSARDGEAGEIDLLGRIDIGRDSADGEWQLEDGKLVGRVGENAIGRLHVPYRPAPQYDLALTVERLLPKGSFVIGLPVQGNQCVVVLDTGGRNDIRGLSQIDGRLANQNETTKRAKTLPGGERISLVCSVRRNLVTVRANDNEIINWQGDASRLSTPDRFPFIDPNDVMLAVHGGAFQITELKLTTVTEASSPVASAKPATDSKIGAAEEMVVEGSLQINKLATPSAADQDAARKKILDTFKVEYGLAKKADGKNLEPRISLAKTLFGKAQDTDDDPAACFVMMSEGARFASKAGQLGLAWEILQALGERFDAAPLPLMLQAAKDAKPFAKSNEEITLLGSMYVLLLDAAILADDFKTAGEAVQEANTSIRKIPVLKDQFAVSGRRVNQLREAFDTAKPAHNILQTNPDDGSANLAWGRYVCFHKGDWATGLPFLAKSSDSDLASLARRDLDQPRTLELLEKLGDDWWSLAEKEKEPVKTILREHAADAWQLALPLASKPERQALDVKIAKLFGSTKLFETTGNGNGVAVAGADLNPGPFFTVEFWVATHSSDGVLISKRHKVPDTSIVLTLERGRPVIGGDSSTGFDRARSRVSINDGRWHHVAAVKAGNRLGLFVDGKTVAQTDAASDYRSVTPWKVGYQETANVSELEARFCRLRFSKEARYLVNFIPEKTYTKDKATIFVP